jgi:NitT/TauT family transport system substrate-binding protein
MKGPIIAVLALAAAVLAGCSKAPSEPLRVASSPWPGYEPLYMARDLGYFGKAAVNLFELPSADITLESFRNRSADVATLTLDEVLELLRGGAKVRLLAVLDTSNGADAAMATPAVRSLADLKGRRVAIVNIPLGVYMLGRMLDAAHLRREDVQVITLSESKHEQLYRKGGADVIVTMEPVKGQLAALGAHAIFDSSRIPGEIVDLLVVHEDVFMQRREEVCDVVRQWFRALDHLKAQPDDALARMGKRLGKSPPEMRKMLEGLVLPSLDDNLKMLGGSSPAILAPARLLNEVMVREKQLPARVDIAPSLDPAIESCIR